MIMAVRSCSEDRGAETGIGGDRIPAIRVTMLEQLPPPPPAASASGCRCPLPAPSAAELVAPCDYTNGAMFVCG